MTMSSARLVSTATISLLCFSLEAVYAAPAVDAHSPPSSLSPASPFPPLPPSGVKIPLRVRSPNASGRSVTELGQIAKRQRDVAIAKYSEIPGQKRSTGYNLLVDQGYDSGYYGSLAIGTPLTSFDVMLDTGSSDLWVVGDTCGSSCNGLATFNPSSSSTFKNLSESFFIQYGQGEASGYVAQDTVEMAGFTVDNQGFSVVDAVSAELLTSPVSGLMGFGWEPLSASGQTPFWQTIASSGAMDSALFAVQLRRYSNDTKASELEPGGELTLGYTNSSLYTGSIDYVDINGSPSYWYLTISSLTVQGNLISLGSSTVAAIDTGTTNIGGPSSAIQAIYAQIPDSSPATGDWAGYYQYPCSTSVTVTISFGSNTWTMSAADFAYTQLSTSECIGAFFETTTTSVNSATPSWIIGDAFLKNVYSVFRYSPAAVGFATLSEEAIAQNGVNGEAAPTPTIGTTTATVTNTSGAASAFRRPGAVAVLGVTLIVAVLSLF